MNYVALLQSLMTSKKVNVGASAGGVIVGLPMIMEKLGINGEPTVPQIILGVLGVAYILIQGYTDHGKETQRINALKEFAGVAIARGVMPDKISGLLKELDGVIGAADATMASPAVVNNQVGGSDINAVVAAVLARMPKESDKQPAPPQLTATTSDGKTVTFPLPVTPPEKA